jgi:hypothetical protein
MMRTCGSRSIARLRAARRAPQEAAWQQKRLEVLERQVRAYESRTDGMGFIGNVAIGLAVGTSLSSAVNAMEGTKMRA